MRFDIYQALSYLLYVCLCLPPNFLCSLALAYILRLHSSLSATLSVPSWWCSWYLGFGLRCGLDVSCKFSGSFS